MNDNENKEETLDLSSLRIRLNGHPQKVENFRFKSGEDDETGKMWLEFDLKDNQSDHRQLVEIEFAGLMSVWSKVVAMQNRFTELSKDLQESGQELLQRFHAGFSAFKADPKRNNNSCDDS
jgi:hypothetical protein